MSPQNMSEQNTSPQNRSEQNTLPQQTKTGANRRTDAKRRTDSEWVAALSGAIGDAAQKGAINDLGRYLYVVINNNLLSRRRSIPLLNTLHEEELSDLTLDFLQEFMEKMVLDDYVLLTKYHAKGRFTAWASQVMLNLVSSELRKAHWARREPLQDHADLSKTMQPDEVALNGQLNELLQLCIRKLPNRMQIVFIRSVIDGESTATIAKEMDVSVNAVHLLVHRAKKQLRQFLNEAGWGSDPDAILGK